MCSKNFIFEWPEKRGALHDYMNMSNPLVTIITPCFNSEKTISRTIESVLNQTYSEIEYIIVDGNSNDNTVSIIKSFEDRFKERGFIFKWISETDNGISDAFNKGIRLASGHVVGILSSDDWYDKDSIKNIYLNYEEKFDIYCGKLNLFDKDNNFVKCRPSRPSLIKFGMYINHPTVFVKKEVYSNIQFDVNLKIAMDYDFILKSLNAGYRIKVIDKVISNMLLGGVSNNMPKMREEEDWVMKNNLTNARYYLAKLKIYFETMLLNF